MTLLRVGRSPLFSSPDQESSKSASAETAIKAASAPWPPIETEIPHCCFYCQWCDAPILLPHESLGLPFGGPLIRRIEARSIGVVCGKCGHAGTYSFFRGCQGFDTRYRFVPARPVGNTLLVAWLYCEEPTCAFPLPFFATLEERPTERTIEELATGWDWKDLMCTSGHTIIVPRGLLRTGTNPPPMDLARAGARRPR
jgi:hypothetical protein